MVIENKVNEDGYSDITRFYLIDDTVCCQDVYGYFWTMVLNGPEYMYIDKSISLVVGNNTPLGINSRDDLIILFNAINANKRNDRLRIEDDSIKARDTKGVIRNVLALVQIAHSDYENTLYCLTEDSDVCELICIEYHNNYQLVVTENIGHLHNDDVLLNNGMYVRGRSNYDIDMDTIVSKYKKIKGYER